jgi:hypothetical protein
MIQKLSLLAFFAVLVFGFQLRADMRPAAASDQHSEVDP